VSRKTRWIVALGILAVVAGGLIVRDQLQARAYESVHPQHGEITEAVYGLGKVKANHRFEVKLGVISTVKKVYVREGDFVQKGSKLIEFDTNALFRAPFDGTVTLISAFEGETATPQSVILRMENLKDRYIEISLEQQGALRIKRGMPAKVSFESLRGKVLQGKVVALFPKDDEFLAHVEAQDLEESVLPGMTADVSIEIGKIQNALLIPVKALSNGTVLIRRNGSKQKVKVEVGHVDGLSAEIKGDSLRPDDEVLFIKAVK
jgi:macrolide-specific efflux system membrane fusion protein